MISTMSGKLDEYVKECIEELNQLHPNFNFIKKNTIWINDKTHICFEGTFSQDNGDTQYGQISTINVFRTFYTK